MRVREQLLGRRCAFYERALRALAEGEEVDVGRVLDNADLHFAIPADAKDSMALICSLYEQLKDRKRRLYLVARENREVRNELRAALSDLEEVRHLLDLQETQYYEVQRERNALIAAAAENASRRAHAKTARLAVWSQHPQKTALLRQLLLLLRALLAGEARRDAEAMRIAMQSLRETWEAHHEFLLPFATP